MIGGYYTVVKLDHEITSAGYDTNVELVYLRSAHRDERNKLGVTGGNTIKGAVTGPEVKVSEKTTQVIAELSTGFIGDAQGNKEIIKQLASGKLDDYVEEVAKSTGETGAILAADVKKGLSLGVGFGDNLGAGIGEPVKGPF